MVDVPVLVQVERNGLVESRHHGSMVVLDATGATHLAVGDVTTPILPRSCLKPLQAAAMVRAGLPLRGEGLALACASHSGEAAHAVLAGAILASGGLTEADLQCAPDLPLDPTVREHYLRAGGGATRLRANCSGKHAAMCLTCVTNGWDSTTYLDSRHPMQLRIRTAAEELAGETITAVAVDGCGAPAYALSLTGLARAYATIAGAPHDDSAQAAVAAAIRGHAWAVGGTGREVTRLIQGIPGIVAKDGAEGVAVAALPDGRAVAVKIEDGDQGRRAAFPALVAGLRIAGVEGDVLDELATVPVLGHGEPVGVARAVFEHAPVLSAP